MQIVRNTLKAAGVIIAIAGGFTLAASMTMPDPAFAGGNGQGKSEGKGQNGKIASELKWRNSAHASANGMKNASSKGRPGMWRDYSASAEAFDQAVSDLAAKQKIVNDLMAIDPLTLPTADIADAQALQDALDSANDDLATAKATKNAAETEMNNASAEMGLDDLSDDAMDRIMALLGVGS